MKLLTRILFLLFIFLTSLTAKSQGEGNIWYFGQNAGIDFNSGAPVALSNSAMLTYEGCASICDQNGALLFYTDGSTVYNSNHQIMPNGMGLLGNGSSTQSAIIIKKPSSTSNYYIVTTDAGENNGANGVRYTEIDMTLQGGLGEVLISNLNAILFFPCSEKLTVVKHQNNTDYWIVAPDPSGTTFWSFLVSAAGVSTVPVISSTINTGNLGSQFGGGYLKANKVGSQLATAVSGSSLSGTVLFDFDNATGLVTNLIMIDSTGSYGLEFSPSGQFLYRTEFLYDSLFSRGIFQNDLWAGNISDIVNSEILIGNAGANSVGAMQLAPNQKIYLAMYNNDSISVINNPDEGGLSANFTPNSFALALNTISTFGLPNYVNTTFSIYEQETHVLCEGDSISLFNSNFQNFNWALSSSPGVIISTDTVFTVSPNNNVSYVLYDGMDTVFFDIQVHQSIQVDLGPDKSLCDTDSILLTNLIAVSGSNISYLWQNGSSNDSLMTNQAGLYWLEISNEACVHRDSIYVNNFSGVDILVNHPICFGTATGSIAANLTGSSGNTFVFTNSQGTVINIAGSNVANTLTAGTYYLEVVGSDGCGAPTPITLVDPPPIAFDLNLTDPLCNGDATGSVRVININNFQGNIDSIAYVWTPNPNGNNGLLRDSIGGLLAGAYTLEVVDDFGCVNSQIFTIDNPKPLEAIITDIKPTYCRTLNTQIGNGVLAAVVPDETNGTPPFSFAWLNLEDGTTSNFSTVVMRTPGEIVLTIKDANNCVYADTVLLDSLNPIADFIIESDEFINPTDYEGTELLSVKITNQSINFAQADNPLSDTIFQWNLFHNELPASNQNWFFSYDLNEKIDTTYEGEQVYEVCLIAKNYNDCADTTCKSITVHDYPVLNTPNVFTPGAYPNNEFFFPAEGIADFECVIFNRYGKKVFEFNAIDQAWDGHHIQSGKLCADGVYFYVYNAMSTNGTPFKGEGQITLIRAKK
ncbi:hypothetical protein DNU06_04605 [Putridiphycobacter roseus]|uniref:Ig-like domain-containing protein n=1 Tax=Putridiphycobacter roseus TaxID=2219161 RepID=A0A2W1NFL7_9FLAO|nr:gliding motility-associated C-terminal domain-containing protein [Putridiphycobacter roseus]PZE17903.1 hypothetical protein DNU06_04605 [Putridiphycobacter roseus]